ncbi:uncharacterized protein LOC121397053 [Xenopus laevis]|nr:uncharacterized protein LOC121397053 [Xenopus laevis]
METQLQLLCTFFLLALLQLSEKTNGSNNNNDVLKVEQPERLTAEVGGSVTINCTFVNKNYAFSVTWSVCEEATDLKNHSCFKQRVWFEDEYHRIITISNLTENDSAKYCCSVESSNKKEAGKGTIVHVMQKQCATETWTKEKWLIIQYIVIGFEAFVIILLLALLKRAHIQNSSDDRFKVKGKQELQTDIHYAEICKERLQPQPRGRRAEEMITYASVAMQK